MIHFLIQKTILCRKRNFRYILYIRLKNATGVCKIDWKIETGRLAQIPVISLNQRQLTFIQVIHHGCQNWTFQTSVIRCFHQVWEIFTLHGDRIFYERVNSLLVKYISLSLVKWERFDKMLPALTFQWNAGNFWNNDDNR